MLLHLLEVMHVAKQEAKAELGSAEDRVSPSMPEHVELYEKLSAEVGIATWEALAPHAERGGLSWIDQSLDLIEVGVSLVIDDARSVQAWHDAQLFLPAAPKAPAEFAAFRFLIIQPFVIASPLDMTNFINPIELDIYDGDPQRVTMTTNSTNCKSLLY